MEQYSFEYWDKLVRKNEKALQQARKQLEEARQLLIDLEKEQHTIKWNKISWEYNQMIKIFGPPVNKTH